jgi:hypothetical protein
LSDTEKKNESSTKIKSSMGFFNGIFQWDSSMGFSDRRRGFIVPLLGQHHDQLP